MPKCFLITKKHISLNAHQQCAASITAVCKKLERQIKCSTCNNPSLPGTVGTPAFFIVSLAVDLSPMTRMLSGWQNENEIIIYLDEITTTMHTRNIPKKYSKAKNITYRLNPK